VVAVAVSDLRVAEVADSDRQVAEAVPGQVGVEEEDKHKWSSCINERGCLKSGDSLFV